MKDETIKLIEFPDKAFATREEAFKHLVSCEKLIIAQKKAAIKWADDVPAIFHPAVPKDAQKAETSLLDSSLIDVKAALNSCNYFDSHKDVSINGSWNRTAKNTKNALHLQEHKMAFANLIADNAYFTVENASWKALGIDAEGETEVLMMHSTISKEDNPFMFRRYATGKVKNHSAGLRYVTVKLAINSGEEEFKAYKAIWDQYADKVINREELDEEGYFWAVTEQKIVEGSAVLRGSNPATNTISVESADSTSTTDNKEAPSVVDTPTSKINLNFY